MRAVIVVAIGLLSATAHAQLEQREPVEAMMIASARTTGMPLVEERLQVAIDGQHATTTLLQVYDNQTGSQTEGSYRLRAGTGSHVEGFAYWNGEQKIAGEVFEKQLATQVYERVKTRRRDPGLLVQDGEGAFSFRVFPIEAREKKRVELRWTKWLERPTHTVGYRAPVSRADAEIVVTIAGHVKDVTSPTHKIHVEKTSDGVRLRSEGARTTGELIVEWNVDEPDWQPVAYVQSAGDGDSWFAAELAAPPVDAKTVAAKDVTIVIDRSGSMGGEAIQHARTAAADMIRRLDARDRINVIAFSDEVDPLFAAPQTLDADARSRAIAFAERLRPGGGTDIGLALKTAISTQDKKAERPRVVVFMTDGQSDVQGALDAAHADTGDVRVFTLGLGADVNRPLLQRIAAMKRGRFVYIEKASDIEPEVARLASTIARPVLVNVSIDVEGANAVRIYPRSVPDLFADDELLITGRLRGKGTAKLVFKGLLGGKAVSFTKSVDFGGAQTQRPWVGRLWAQARVDHLLEELSLGAKDADEMKTEVTELALAYNFVTPYTAFLAIPASELGEMRSTVAEERARKAKILADHPDAASLGGREAGKDDEAKTAPLQTASAGDDDGIDENEPGDAEEEDADPSPRSSYGKVKGNGCASCATGGDGRQASLLVLCVALLLRRRRR
jgi:Ca-activated chloride channel family protein